MFIEDSDEITGEEYGSSHDDRLASSRTSSGLSIIFESFLMVLLLPFGVVGEVFSCLPSTLSL